VSRIARALALGSLVALIPATATAEAFTPTSGHYADTAKHVEFTYDAAHQIIRHFKINGSEAFASAHVVHGSDGWRFDHRDAQVSAHGRWHSAHGVIGSFGPTNNRHNRTVYEAKVAGSARARAAHACTAPSIHGLAVQSLSVHGIECDTGTIYLRHYLKHGSPPGWTCRREHHGTRGTRLSCEHGERWFHASWTVH
jgi:hypothetical protein